MTNVQIERMIMALEKIEYRLQETASSIIRLEFTNSVYDEAKRISVLSKTYAITVYFPYRMTLEIGQAYNINVDSVTYSGPDFYLNDLSVPRFTAYSYEGFVGSHNKSEALIKFREKEESLFVNGWQLVKEVIEDD